MGPTWVLSAPDGPHVGPMNLAIRDDIHSNRSTIWVVRNLLRELLTVIHLTNYAQRSRSVLFCCRQIWNEMSSFDEILITGCTGSCHFDNFQCSQWLKFHQNQYIYVSVMYPPITLITFSIFSLLRGRWWFSLLSDATLTNKGSHTNAPVIDYITKTKELLQWRHNGRDSVSNHQPHDCLLNRLFRRRSKKTSKLRDTGLNAGNSPGPVNSPHRWPVTR